MKLAQQWWITDPNQSSLNQEARQRDIDHMQRKDSDHKSTYSGSTSNKERYLLSKNGVLTQYCTSIYKMVAVWAIFGQFQQETLTNKVQDGCQNESAI